MFRYRRYRAFIAFAVISVLAFYHFSGYASWTAAPAVGAGSLKQPGALPAGGNQAPPAPPVPQAGPDSDSANGEEKDTAPEELPPHDDALHEVVTAASTSPSLAKQTWVEQPVPPHPKAQDTSDKLQLTHTSTLAEEANYNKPVVTNPPTVPLQEVDEILGHGRHEVTDQPAAPSVHWSKQIEHFPVSSTIQLPSGTPKAIPRIQHVFEKESEDERIGRKQKLKAITDAATHAWKGYRENAWKHDEVRPVSGGHKDPFCGWAATLVDALDTLWIMGMKDEFEEAVRAVGEIDFSTSTRKDIPLFETTIRYMGGMLSAYDLSDGKYVTLLDKAVELAEILMGAFDTPNRMPITYYHWMPTFASQPHRAGTRVVMAELGSLSMEFTRLAQITREPKYYDAIDRVTDAFHEWQQSEINGTLLPGLFPTYVDASGCEKPAQIKVEPQLVNDVFADAGEPVRAARPPGQGPLSSVAKEDKSTLGQGVPGKGKIVGWDDPIEEGSLDSKAAKEEVLQKTGSQLESAPAPAKPIGKLGKVAGWDDSVEHVEDSKAAKGETLRKVPSHLESDSAAAPPVGNMGKIAGWKEPIEEGSLDSAAARKELMDELHNEYGKQKRQLGGELADHKFPTIPDRMPEPLRQQTGPDAAGDAICVPRGLASTKRRGSDTFTIGGMADSTYEYFPKQYILLGGLVTKYQDLYERSMDAVIDKLLFRPMTPENHDILFSGEYTAFAMHDDEGKSGSLKAESAHLTCFAGAMFALGSKVFGRKQDLDIGSKLTDGCVWAYNVTATGIMPEMGLLSACEDRLDCTWNKTKYYDELDPHNAARSKVHDSVRHAAPKTSPVHLDEAEQQAQTDTAPRQQKAAPEARLDTDAGLKRRQVGASPGQLYPKLADADDEDRVPTKVAPSGYNVADNDAFTPFTPPTHEEFVEARIRDERLPAGFTKVTDKRYILRPEAIESVFYLHRITGDPHWREVGWNMFKAIQTYTYTEYGNSAISDVTTTAPRLEDTEESFWLAETLKYFFLLFSDDTVLSLDEWVLNTEAHPFRRPDAPAAKKAATDGLSKGGMGSAGSASGSSSFDD